MDDFLVRACLAGIGVAIIAGPYGCLLIWRRMAFFGATLSHGALLGLALGLMAGISPSAAIVIFCVAAAVLFVAFERNRLVGRDTLLAVIAHATLAAGLVVLAFLETVRVDLLSYLFGDILAVTVSDLVLVYAGGGVALVVLLFIWRSAFAITLDEDLARIDGISVRAVNAALTLMMALVIAVAIKIVGILLVVSLLIIPAAAGRRFARTPEAMAVMASAIGVAAVAGGLGASAGLDTPAGPSIVVAATILFLIAWAVPARLTAQRAWPK